MSYCAYVGITALLMFCAFVAGAKRRQLVVKWSRVVQFLCFYLLLIRRSKGGKSNCSNDDWRNHQPLLWAHAGGADPVIYGNAMENFDRAIAKGFRCIEADVCVTTDGVPVLTHGFRPNNENLYERKPTSEDFLRTKIDDKYTPMTLSGFIERYRNFDGWIFLDGLRFGKKLGFDFRSYFASIDDAFRRKIIVQVFDFRDLLALKRDNSFGGIHFSGVFGIGTNKLLRPMLLKVLKSCGVQSVSLSDWEILDDDISDVIADFRSAGIVVSVAGCNTLSYYSRLRKIGVNCIDTDYLVPDDLKNLEG